MLLKNRILATLSFLLLAVLAAGLFPAAGWAQQEGEQSNFFFVNYLGQPVTLDLDDTTYTVPAAAPGADGGRLAFSLAPGEHKYAVNAAGVPTGTSGTFVIEAGQVVGKAIRLEQTGPALDREGNVLQKPEDYIFIFDIDPFATPTAPAPVVDTWQPAPAPAGMGSLAWINYTGDELTVDLNGQVYRVPPQSDTIPGRLQTDVTPGLYQFTASIPYGAVSGEVNVEAGQVSGLSVSAELQPEPEYDVGEPVTIPQVTLRLDQEDLTARAIAAPAPAETVQPESMPVPEATPTPVAPATPMATEGLLIKSYIGETVIFTIAGQQYFIPAGTQQTIQLDPGQYNFMASLPYVAQTGTVDLTAGQGITLSLSTNVAGDVLNVYREN